jgi:hypothetical protein
MREAPVSLQRERKKSTQTANQGRRRLTTELDVFANAIMHKSITIPEKSFSCTADGLEM